MSSESARQYENGGLAEVLASPAFARLVLYFALHGEEPQHLRAIQRQTGLSMSSLHRELEWLEGRGLIERQLEGPRVLFQAVESHSGWKSLRQLVRDFADPVEVVEEALAGVEGIEAAFVFGSFARGDHRDDSDVDVLVVGDRLAEARLGVRQPRPRFCSAGRWRSGPTRGRGSIASREAGNAVLRRILEGAKRWIVGDEQRLGVAAWSRSGSIACWRRTLETSPASDDEVVAIWAGALREWTDSQVPGLS